MKEKFLTCIVFIILILTISVTSYASEKRSGIENFPASYKPYLYELKNKYPNWEFTALYTGIDWNTAILNEYSNDKNLVPITYSDNWKCTDGNKYNVQIDAGWVNASRRAVEYTMDPRNFLTVTRMFQFEKLSYDANTNTQEGIEKILYGTEFYRRIVQYKDYTGQSIATNNTYSDLIWSAAIYSGISPYHLASRIKQEVGPFITHNSISGTVRGYEGLYNFYNIGATSSTTTLGAIKNGLQYAKDGRGALEDVRINQLIPWGTPEKAIKGGAVFIGSKYISAGQNTLYLQKFDVNNDRSQDLFWHQYMTNCLAPFNESNSIYKAYNSNGMLSSSIGFLIPVYENMPEYATQNPNISDYDYISDNTRVYADVTGNLNVRIGPSVSNDIITTVNRDNTFTRIGKGNQAGERWDRVILDNGILGYVFQSYIKERPVIVEEPELQPELEPGEGNTPTIPKEPEENTMDIQFDESLRLEIDKISNINLEKSKVSDIKQLITTQLDIKMYNAQDELLTEDQQIATGSKLVVTDIDNNKYTYTFIIYGDVNGDGIINSLDVLIIQKHILETKLLTGIFLKAGNISKNGQMPNSLDVLKIQKHILETKFIEQ